MFSRTTFSEFSLKHGKDERFKDIAKMREREGLFSDYVAELRKLEREASQKKKDFVDEKVTYYFQCRAGPGPQERMKQLISGSACAKLLSMKDILMPLLLSIV